MLFWLDCAVRPHPSGWAWYEEASWDAFPKRGVISSLESEPPTGALGELDV